MERIREEIDNYIEHVDRVRELERQLFYLEEFIGQKGFWKESQNYIEKYQGEPVPFEIE